MLRIRLELSGKMQLRVLTPQIFRNSLTWQRDPFILLENSSLPLPREQAKTLPETNACQAMLVSLKVFLLSHHCF